ncbi:transferase [Paraclostridium bifermentans]|uniref:acyltransferase n=1 Tax=Paraclostridium bifermentans TaxID=1490 RepID=UPI000A174EC5|nr:acyltransferase [Paraclostridium bifermentans]OSB10698.1 transferase [Paraclostridium bifermentans]
MKTVEYIIRKIKGDDFKLDKEISILYLFGIVSRMVLNLVRGNIKTAFVKNRKLIIFVGKNSKIKMKRKVRLGSGVNIGNDVIIDALSREGVKIGKNVKIGDYTRIMCTGTIRSIGKGFEIGENCGIGENCYFGAAGGIKIGNDVIMGQNVRFHSENHNYDKSDILIRLQGVTNKGIIVGSDCWIGSGVVLLDGVSVGDGCVIGANTIVNKNLPNNSIAVGNPVKIIKKRSGNKNKKGIDNEENIIC